MTVSRNGRMIVRPAEIFSPYAISMLRDVVVPVLADEYLLLVERGEATKSEALQSVLRMIDNPMLALKFFEAWRGSLNKEKNRLVQKAKEEGREDLLSQLEKIENLVQATRLLEQARSTLFPSELPLIEELRREFLRLVYKERDHRRRQLNARGASRIRERLSNLIDRVDDIVNAAMVRIPPSLRDRFDFNDDVWGLMDACELLEEVARANRSHARDSLIAGVRGSHAAFRLAVAVNMLLIELADPALARGKGLNAIQRLRRERLFEAEEERLVYLAARVVKKTKAIVGHSDIVGCTDAIPLVAVGASRELALESLENDGRGERGSETKVFEFVCRVVVKGSTRYLVATRFRPKDMFSTLVKTGRKLVDPYIVTSERLVHELMKDNRGWRETLVAVEEDGKMRVATRTDLDAYYEIVFERLWNEEPLVAYDLEEDKDNNGHAHRASGYYDTKILGHIVTVDDELEFHGPCEQLFLTAFDHLHCNVLSRDDENHERRKARQVLEWLVDALPADRCFVWSEEMLTHLNAWTGKVLDGDF